MGIKRKGKFSKNFKQRQNKVSNWQIVALNNNLYLRDSGEILSILTTVGGLIPKGGGGVRPIHEREADLEKIAKTVPNPPIHQEMEGGSDVCGQSNKLLY